jgi:creatine kinase/arginine kinase
MCSDTTTGARPVFSGSCTSLLKKYLTEAVWQQLANTETANGYSFAQAIRSGVEQQDSSIGVYAGDEESYQLFAPLLDPIIEEYHGSAGPHPASDFSHDQLPVVSSEATARIVSSRIRVGRNLAGFPLGPAISRAQRQQVEAQVICALAELPTPLQGEYFPLSNMEEGFRKDLVARHLLFKSEDRFLDSAGLMRDWPEARGIFISRDESFCVWVNEEDQLRIIAGVAALSQQLEFLSSAACGYLASCPSNLGTAMRASVHMKLAALGANEKDLQVLADTLGLQVRGIHGEHSESSGGVFDISNRMRLGVTEAEAVGHLIRGVNQLAGQDHALTRRAQ